MSDGHCVLGRRALGFCLALGALAACGGDDGTRADASGDGALDASGGDGSAGEVVPLAPSPPVLGPCASGWREVRLGDDPPVCEPWPEGGRMSCGPDEAHYPGAPGCVPIGSPCPTGDFPGDLPTDRALLYVRAGASGGDGSEATPFDTVTRALAAATAGTTVVVGAGTYDEEIRMPAHVHLRGACPSLAVLTSSRPTTRGASQIRIDDPDIEVRDLSIVDSPQPAIIVNGAPDARIRGVRITRATLASIMVLGGSHVTLEDAALHGARSLMPGFGGRAMDVTAATIDATRVDIAANLEYAVVVSDPGGSIRLRDAVVRDGLSREDNGEFGGGVQAQAGAALDLAGVVIEDNRYGGVRVKGAGSTLLLEDSVVRRTVGQVRDGTFGRAVEAQQSATITVRRSLLEDNDEFGLMVVINSEATLEDLVIRDNEGPADGSDGAGDALRLQDNATVTAARIHAVRNTGVGIAVHGPGSVARIEDLVCSETRPKLEGRFGRGVGIQTGGRLELTRALIADNHDLGIAGLLDTAMVGRDIVVRGTRSRPADGTRGAGLSFEFGSVAELSQAVFEDNRSYGVGALGPGARLLLEDVRVSGTSAEACEGDTCVAGSSGSAAGAFTGGALRAERFSFAGSALCGVIVTEASEADLTQGRVANNLIGACVQAEAFDVGRLSEGVAYAGNGVNLESTTLPVPEPTTPL